MPATSAEKEYDVLAHFRVKENGKSVVYDPAGTDGWPGAKSTFKGDPNSEQVKDLLAGAGGVHGPLIAEKKSTSSGSSTGSASKEN